MAFHESRNRYTARQRYSLQHINQPRYGCSAGSGSNRVWSSGRCGHVSVARFIAYPNDHARCAHVLWLAHSWRMDCSGLDPTPSVHLTREGNRKDTGTRSQRVSGAKWRPRIKCHNGLRPLLTCTQHCAHTFYDEIDTVYGRNAKGNEELRGVLNSGHRRSGKAGRGSWNNGSLEARQYRSYCAVAVAGLHSLPDTIADRAVIIRMRRRATHEHVQPWRDRLNGPEARELGSVLSQWTQSADFPLPQDMPVSDRPADVWESLIAVADAAGGRWPQLAREAAVAMVTASRDNTTSVGVQLLRDLRIVFRDTNKMTTTQILTELEQLAESPWRNYHHNGNALSPRDLSKLLGQYEVKSRNLRQGDHVAKGYYAEDLADAWTRYLPDASESATSATTTTSQASQSERTAGRRGTLQ